MSESIQRTLAEANERHGQLSEGGNRLVPLAAAIIAVLAALGTLFSHHGSIAALSTKNQAILTQQRASDTYNAYEAKRIRYNTYQALLASDMVRSDASRAAVKAIAEKEKTSSETVLDKAQALEERANREEERSETFMRSYEILQFGTTWFEIAIILISISALAKTRILLTLGSVMSVVGIGFLLVGLLQGR